MVNNVTKIGALVLALGLLFPMIGIGLPSLATVIYPEVFWYALTPDGTSSSPSMITPGAMIQIKAQLVYQDSANNILLDGDPNYWDVSCELVELNKVVKLSYWGEAQAGDYRTHIFTASYTFPTDPGMDIELFWKATVVDYNYNPAGTFETRSYARIMSATQPDGIFRINGRDASQDTTILVANPSLQLSFTPTAGASSITGVYVDVYKGTASSYIKRVSLAAQSPNYGALYTLPGTGAYSLKGYIQWSQGNVPKMSMVIVLPPDRDEGNCTDANQNGVCDEDEDRGVRPLDFLNIASISGLGIIALGTVRKEN